MILVDTSVWVDRFRKSEPRLVWLLESRSVATHPFVIEEIALGSIKDRKSTLENLVDLPSVTIASHDETLAFIETGSLAGTGVGYVDADAGSKALDPR